MLSIMKRKEIYEQPATEVVEMESQGIIAASGDGEAKNPDPGTWH